MAHCETCGHPCKNRFCTRQCSGKARLKQVTFTCVYCNTEFSDWASRAGKAKSITCSHACRYNYEAQQQLANFWDNVDQSGGPDACWPWMGSIVKDRMGYGRFFLCGKSYRAHRMAYLLVNGPLLEDEQALHTCDVPRCCNPSHLFKGTGLDNMRDMVAKGRQASGDRILPHNRARGERHGRSKLNNTTARACYALKGTMSQERAGALYGIDQTVVSDLWNHKIWRHIHHLTD